MELGLDMTLVSSTNEHCRLKLAQSVATATNIRKVQQEIANATAYHGYKAQEL